MIKNRLKELLNELKKIYKVQKILVLDCKKNKKIIKSSI